MTTGADLITRVRSNINESTAKDRSDAEILQWLTDAQLDYLHKIPTQHFPELHTTQTFTGSSCSMPSDYLFFWGLTVTHTISGTYTEDADCFMLNPGETYLIKNYYGNMGAWGQIVGGKLLTGPQTIRGTLSYLKKPTTLSATTTTFSVGQEHEEPIVCKATSLALLKVNDADSDKYLALYESNIQARIGRGESGEIERA